MNSENARAGTWGECRVCDHLVVYAPPVLGLPGILSYRGPKSGAVWPLVCELRRILERITGQAVEVQP